jgi:hypothetical protein
MRYQGVIRVVAATRNRTERGNFPRAGVTAVTFRIGIKGHIGRVAGGDPVGHTSKSDWAGMPPAPFFALNTYS